MTTDGPEAQRNVRVTLLGCGLMGSPMSLRLLKYGYDVTVWNRTASKTRLSVERGARAAATPVDAVKGAEIVIVILENGDVVGDVLFNRGVADALEPHTLAIDMTSAAPWIAQKHAQKLSEYGIEMLDAPVSGGPTGVDAGTLAIMVGGTETAYRRAEPLLKSLGQPTLVGGSGAGQLTKLCNQMITAAALTAVSEMVVFAETNGIDPEKVRQALVGGFADSKVLQIHGSRMARRDFEPGGHVRTFYKDLTTVLRITEERGLRLPCLKLTSDLFHKLNEYGCAEKDISSIFIETKAKSTTDRSDHTSNSGRDHAE